MFLFLPRMAAHIRKWKKWQVLNFGWSGFIYSAKELCIFIFSCSNGQVMQQIFPSSSTAKPLHYNCFPDSYCFFPPYSLVLLSALLTSTFCFPSISFLLKFISCPTSDSWTWGPETIVEDERGREEMGRKSVRSCLSLWKVSLSSLFLICCTRNSMPW